MDFLHESAATRVGLEGKLTNVSSQPIVAFDVAVDLSPGHGGGNRKTFKVDYFLRPELLFPGSEYDVQVEPHTIVTQYRGDRSLTRAKAQLRVLFVQFADGSVYGRSSWGDELRGARQTEIAILNDFVRSYEEGQEAGLTAAIAADLASNKYSLNRLTSVYGLLEEVNDDLRHEGASNTVHEIRTYLYNAHRHMKDFPWLMTVSDGT